MSTPTFDPRLYLVAGSGDVDQRGIDAIVRQAVEGGVTLFQLREKDMATGAFIESARSLRDALRGTEVRLLINDRVDVALAANVDGVHIGQDDITARATSAVCRSRRSQEFLQKPPAASWTVA